MVVKSKSNAAETLTPVAAPVAPRFNVETLRTHAVTLWGKGYDGWDSAESIPGVFAASLGRALTTEERTASVNLFRGVVYGTTDGTLRRVKGSKVSSKAKYESLGGAEGLTAAFSKALTAMLDAPAAPIPPKA